MHEVELKAVLDDWEARRAGIERAGAALTFAGRLEDRRYDTPARDLARRDVILRLRVHRDAAARRATLGWKGPTERVNGYKVREEHETAASDADAMGAILERLGYVVTRAIDREIAQFDLAGTTVRFERYPRMDDLVEVEGSPAGIERAIAALGMPRSAFSADRLPDFARRYVARTGLLPALSDAELAGAAHYELDDA